MDKIADKRLPSFYDARRRLEQTVYVGEHPITVKTFSFFDHSKLEYYRLQYAKCLDAPSTPEERLDKLKELLDATKLDWRSASLYQLPNILTCVVNVNPAPPKLAWQPDTEESTDLPTADPNKKDDDGLDYSGRQIAGIAAFLSEILNVSVNYVLDDMTYYEVNCLMQEALLLEHRIREWQYALAGDVGIEKVGSEFRKIPLPAPEWMGTETLKESNSQGVLNRILRDKEKINKKLKEKGATDERTLAGPRPSGDFVDFTKMGADGRPMQAHNEADNLAAEPMPLTTLLPESGNVRE